MLDNRYPHDNPEFDLSLDLREAINEDPLSFESVVIIMQALIQFQPEIFDAAEEELLESDDPDLTLDDCLIGQIAYRGLIHDNPVHDVLYIPPAGKLMLEQYADEIDQGIHEEDHYSQRELQNLQNRLNALQNKYG